MTAVKATLLRAVSNSSFPVAYKLIKLAAGFKEKNCCWVSNKKQALYKKYLCANFLIHDDI
jgi:hypothetical protein